MLLLLRKDQTVSIDFGHDGSESRERGRGTGIICLPGSMGKA